MLKLLLSARPQSSVVCKDSAFDTSTLVAVKCNATLESITTVGLNQVRVFWCVCELNGTLICYSILCLFDCACNEGCFGNIRFCKFRFYVSIFLLLFCCDDILMTYMTCVKRVQIHAAVANFFN